MSTSAKAFLASAAFGVAVAVAYWLATSEPAGTALLASMALAPALVAGYLFVRARKDSSPSDDPRARPEDAAGEVVGSFPVGSLWPIVLAAGLVLATAGLAYWPWLFAVGAAIGVVGVVGLMRESRG